MPRFNRRTGIYTLEMKRLGTLPMRFTVGQSPTGPITVQQPAPSSLPGGSGVSPNTVRVLVQAYGAAERLEADSNRSDLVFATRFIRVALEQSLMHLNADGLVSTTTVRAALSAPSDPQQHSDIVFFVHAATPTVDVNQVLAQISTGTQTSSSPTVPQQATLPNFRANVTFTPGSGSGGLQQQTTSAADSVITQGGSGAAASQAQTQAVLDAHDSSTVIPATGPTMSLPGYAPIGVTPTTDPSAAPVSGLPQWWKPALAVAIGAAVGVGIGRAVAG
jgi:hypothetical protein